MGVIIVYAGHELNFELKKIINQIHARNTSDAVSMPS